MSMTDLLLLIQVPICVLQGTLRDDIAKRYFSIMTRSKHDLNVFLLAILPCSIYFIALQVAK